MRQLLDALPVGANPPRAMREQNAVNGIRCLQQLGLHKGEPLDLESLARAEGLERGTVADLLTSLGTAGFVETIPGTTGRYRLTRPPSQIRVAEVWASLLERPSTPGFGGPTLQNVIEWEERAFQHGDPAEAV
jgi:DNA-binding IscR family transcriptional regulator